MNNNLVRRIARVSGITVSTLLFTGLPITYFCCGYPRDEHAIQCIDTGIEIVGGLVATSTSVILLASSMSERVQQLIDRYIAIEDHYE